MVYQVYLNFLKAEHIFLYRDFSNTETLCSEQKYYCEMCCSKQEAQKRCVKDSAGGGSVSWGGIGLGCSTSGFERHRQLRGALGVIYLPH